MPKLSRHFPARCVFTSTISIILSRHWTPGLHKWRMLKPSKSTNSVHVLKFGRWMRVTIPYLIGTPRSFVASAVLMRPSSQMDSVNLTMFSTPHERSRPFMSSKPNRSKKTGRPSYNVKIKKAQIGIHLVTMVPTTRKKLTHHGWRAPFL